MIRLLTRADDAGCAKSANLAIQDACENGIARNVSFMACGPEIGHAAGLLKDLKGVAFGMHITLNCEWVFPKFGPVADTASVPDLLDDNGHFTLLPRILHENGVPLEQILTEVNAQLQKLRSYGLDIAYMDEHMGINWVNDGLGEALREFAEREGLVYEMDADRLPMNNGLANRVDAMRDALNTIEDGTYLSINHPVYPGSDFHDFVLPDQEKGVEETNRDAQRRCFMDEGVVRIVTERGIELITYSDL